MQDFGDHQGLYSDVNGDQWLQPIGRTSVRLTVAPTIGTDRLTGAMTCYLPPGGRCPITADGAVVTAQTGALDPNQTMTIAVGFAPDTVIDPGGRGLAGVDLAPYVGGAGGGVLALTLLWLAVAGLRGRRTDVPLVAGSTPPDDLSPAFAACLLGRPERAISAELLHQAVNGTIRLAGEGGLIRAQRIDRLRLPAGGDRGRLVNRALQSVFDVPNLDVGEQVDDVAASVRRTRARPLAKEYARFSAASAEGLWRRRSWLVDHLHLVMFAGALVAVVLLAPLTSIPVVLVGVGALLIAAAIVRGLVAAPRLSPAGQETVRHLLGLQMFIRTADTHRLELIQGARTAERDQDDDGVAVRAADRLGGRPRGGGLVASGDRWASARRGHPAPGRGSTAALVRGRPGPARRSTSSHVGALTGGGLAADRSPDRDVGHPGRGDVVEVEQLERRRLVLRQLGWIQQKRLLRWWRWGWRWRRLVIRR